MRIALICPYSLSLPGGVQGQILSLARALRAQGHDTRVLGPCDGPPPDSGVTPLGKTIPLAANGSVAPIAPDIPCALRTIRVLREEQFDVVHLHEPLVPGPTLTALLFSDQPMIGTFHRAGVSDAYSWLRIGTRLAANRLKLRCAVSEDARNTAKGALGGTYELVFNGIDVSRYAKATPTESQGPTLFFIGRHEPRKGLRQLIEAMEYLPVDVRLWIAGTGPQTEELRALTVGDSRIQWLGRISDAEAACRMRGADVFCAPSLERESFGVVLLEAMAAGTPIVASDLAGYRNVVRSDVDALLIKPGDTRALATAVSRVLADASLADRLTVSGMERAAGWSMDRLAELYLAMYEKVTLSN